jgi:hypothetical protein
VAEFFAHVTSARKLYHSLVLSGAYPGVFSIWVNPAVTIVIRPAAHPDEALLGVEKQRKSPGRLENPLAADGGSDPDTDHGLSLSSGN